MAVKGIDYVLSLNPTKFNAAVGAMTARTRAAAGALSGYWQKTEQGVLRAGNAVTSMRAKIAAAVAAIGGVYAVGVAYRSVVAAAIDADKAAFNLGTSIQAANREFRVGDADRWRQSIKGLVDELKIYSGSAIEAAAAKTIDMTKRLGLSEQQMLKVIRAAANLSAGKFELSDGVERVTAALRGEAEASEALGLTLSETYVKGWYEARGAQQGAWKDLDDLQKAQVRYHVLLQQSDPLLGKAAKSAGTYGGAMAGLSGAIDTVKASIGEAVTRNAFFVEGVGRISEIVQGLDADVDANRQKWMQWGKDGVLAVLDFGAASIRAVSGVYQVFSGLAGGVKETLGYYYELKAAFLEGAASGSKWKDAIGLTSGEAQRLGNEAAVAAAKSEELRASAQRSFAEMQTGAPKVLEAANSLQKFRDELARIEAKEINIEALAEPAKKVEEEIAKVGNRWVGVAKEIETSNRATSSDVATTWDGVWDQFESGAIESIEDVEKALQALTKDRSVAVRVRQVEARATGGLIGGYKFGGLIQALAGGGRVRNILGGGWLPGFGGGDRRLLYGEDGEVMLNKWAVRAGGLKAALAFNAGQFGVVIEELMKRRMNAVGYNLGGVIGASPSARTVTPSSPGYSGTLTFATPDGHVGRVFGSEVDVRAVERAIKKQQRYSSGKRS